MKNILLIILLILVFQHISGQDIITTKDKKQLNVKIIEQTDKSVRYKMPDYEDSPVIMVKTKNIRKIEYKNGHVDLSRHSKIREKSDHWVLASDMQYPCQVEATWFWQHWIISFYLRLI